MKLPLLDQVERAWDGCQKCDLSAHRRQIVHWRGDPDAKLFIIGEGPGADEDAEGLPFAGASGRLVDELLKRAGIQPSGVFIANMVGCRLPGLRAPDRDELKACAPRLQQMLRIVSPRVLLLFGPTAATLAYATTVGPVRGSMRPVDVLCYDGKVRSWPAFVTWSPPFLVRNGGANGERFQESLCDVQDAWKLANSVDGGPIR